jgi:hypothetical protein
MTLKNIVDPNGNLRRYCPDCKEYLPLDRFYAHKQGLSGYCKVHHRVRAQASGVKLKAAFDAGQAKEAARRQMDELQEQALVEDHKREWDRREAEAFKLLNSPARYEDPDGQT